ncbi:MAG: hypothetical protein HYY06_22735 [Deltaproteobacteria bacterium]|nr:hypothetical protein [Deltaproteobacteria bacterium]
MRRLRRREGAPPGAGARVEKATTWSLLLLAAVGIGNYFGFDTRTLVEREEFDGYDLVHYYLNAKYFDELGYTHLYEAIVIADSERKDNYRKWRFTALRDLDTSVRVPIRTVYARADEIKGLFSPPRWKQFKRDFRFLQRTIKRKSQERLLNDHGYNGPPFLQSFAGFITNRVPVERVKLLCHLETLLILVMFVVVYRTYGTRVLALSVLWFTVDFSARWPGIGYGIFRLDWFVALVIACCLMKGTDADAPTNRQKWRAIGAGVLVAWATMMKIFPIVWLFGMGARGLWLLVARRRLDPVAVRLLAGFLVASAVFAGVSYRAVGMRNIEEFAEDISEHLQPMNLSQQRMGFGIALSYRGEYEGGFSGMNAMHRKWELVGELKTLRYGIGLVALFLLGMTIRSASSASPGARTEPDDATHLGFIPFYFLMIASHYYWIHRMTALLHHAKYSDERPDHLIGLALLFAIDAMSNYVDRATHFRYAVTGLTSVSLGLYCAWVIGNRLWRTLRQPPALPQSEPASPSPEAA